MGSVAAERTTTSVEAELYERHSDLVYRYCLRMLRSREDAEDATQTTFFQALRAMRRGVVPAFEQAWLLAIARNECKSRFRAGSRRRERELTHDPHLLEELAEAPNGGDGRLVGVQQALGRLPENQRRALLLREWQGQSYAEIAHALGTTRPAVEALLFRARRGLARELGEETTSRKHAFDLASLLGALKSLLSGGAAVKLAAGVAAVATVGTVAADTRQGTRPPTAVERPASATVRSGVPSAADPVSRSTRARASKQKAGTGTKPAAATRRTKPEKTRQSPSAPTRSGAPGTPAVPGAEQQAPQSGSPNAPATPPVLPAGTPAVPRLPAPPQALPVVPPIETPQLPPPLPQLPQVQAPAVEAPQLPPLPVDAPDLPVVEDLPVVGDLLP